MANKTTQQPPPPRPPEYTAEQAIQAIQQRIDEGEALLIGLPSKDDDEAWRFITEEVLKKAFGAGASQVHRIMSAGPPHVVSSFADHRRLEAKRRQRLEAVVSQLRAAIELFQLPSPVPTIEDPLASETETSEKRIFLVHGRNDNAKFEVARFLEKIGQTVTILHEQPNGGRTIIEKFERYAKASFAVVLLTPDDVGRLASDDANALEPRARQNVIFELGYFLGSLGRDRVCALCAPGLQPPSDYAGVVFVPFVSGGDWKYELIKELKEAGFEIDF